MTRTSKPDEPWIQLEITEEQWHKREAKAKAAAEGKPADVDLIDGQDDAAHGGAENTPITGQVQQNQQKPLAPTPGYHFDKNGKEVDAREYKPRKQRSDKGKPKAVKPVAATQEVASKRIYNLSERVAKAAAKIGTAKAEFEAAKTELQSYMETL